MRSHSFSTLRPTSVFPSFFELSPVIALACAACAAPGTSNAVDGGEPDGTMELDAGFQSTTDGAAVGVDAPIGPGVDATIGDSGAGEAAAESGSTPDAGGGEGDAGNSPEGGSLESGSPEGGVGCSSLPLCDNFDQDTPGTKPANWTLVLGCNASQMMDTPVDGGLLVGVDSSQHHSGANSVRVVGGDSCGYYFENTTAVAALAAGKQLYARFWVMFSGPPTMNHNGFMSMGLTSTMSTAPQLRLGFQSNVVDWNYIPPDTTLPDLSPTGVDASVATAANTWTCIEFHVDETTGHLEFWLNGGATSIPGLTYSGTSVNGIDDQWATGGPPAPVVPTSFGLGWLGLNNQYTVWYDDVALGGARIGCN